MTAHKEVSDLLGREVDLDTRQAVLAIVGELEARLAEVSGHATVILQLSRPSRED